MMVIKDKTPRKTRRAGERPSPSTGTATDGQCDAAGPRAVQRRVVGPHGASATPSASARRTLSGDRLQDPLTCILQPGGLQARSLSLWSRRVAEAEADDVIDLGAPRAPRPAVACARAAYTPSPRLYPGPRAAAEARTRPARGGCAPRDRRRRLPCARLHRVSPRLYRVPPRRAPPPNPSAPTPRRAWAPPASAHARLDTASGAALRLSERLRSPRRGPAPAAALARRPPAPAPRPAMEAPSRQSTSPEDRSDGNDTLSAPSEFLAEFLSAIMRRQYAEALKYCRLILQYEPQNATARGFYPLLRLRTGGRQWLRDSSSEEASRAAAASAQELMHVGGDSEPGASSGSQSSLELDTSDEHSESGASPSLGDSAGWSSGSGARDSWPAERAADDNGNAPPTPPAPRPDDVENDNASSSAGESPAAQLQSESAATLRRLRAQFACSIK